MGLGGGCDCISLLSRVAKARSDSRAWGGLEDTTSGASSSEFESEAGPSCCSAGISGGRVGTA
jgi:hypothetical protein